MVTQLDVNQASDSTLSVHDKHSQRHYPFPMKIDAMGFRRILQSLVHTFCLLYLARLYYLGFSDRLGADPVESIIHSSGTTALILLLLTLCVSPLTRWIQLIRSPLRRGSWMRLRRPLGLWSFAFAANHLACYLAFELHFNWTQLWEDVTQRWYIIFGALALLILMALSITSLPYLLRKMGKSWKRLHNSVYLAVCLAWLHFTLSLKADWVEPGLYAIAIALLLLLRTDRYASVMKKWRTNLPHWLRRLAKN